MDYSFYDQKEKAKENTAGPPSKAVQEFNKSLERAKRITAGDEESPEAKQQRFDVYNDMSKWTATVEPESTIHDAPTEIYDYMQQDDEEGYGSAHYLASRTAGTIAGLKDRLAGVFSFMSNEPDLRTFMLQHPKFEEAGPTAQTALGNALGHVRSMEMKLEARGLEGNDMQPLDIIKSGWDYVKAQIGERGLSRLPEGERGRVIGALWTQEIIRNSSLKDPNKAIDYIMPKVRREIGEEFAVPFQDSDALFHTGMKRLQGVNDELDGTVDGSSLFNEAVVDPDTNSTTRNWFKRITGRDAPEDASVDDVMRVIRPYLGVYSAAVDKAEMAYKWHLAGVDVPIRRIHRDGTLFSLTELPGAGKVATTLARNVNDDIAYDNVDDFSRLHAARRIQGKLSGNVVDYVRDELGMSDEAVQRLMKHKVKARGPFMEWQYVPHDQLFASAETNEEKYYLMNRLATFDEGLRTAISAKKREYAEEWRKRNEEKIKERSLEQGMAPEVVGEFLKNTHARSQEAAELRRRRQEAYNSAYLYRYGNEIFHLIGAAAQSMGGGEFGEAMSGIHKYLYASAHNGIAKTDLEALGLRDRAWTDAVRDRLSKLPFFPEDPNEALNDYLDKVIEDRHVPILDQLGMVTVDALHGLMELPLMTVENPWSTGMMFGALKKYNTKSVGAAKKLATKLGRPGLEAPILAVIRPHEFAANAGKASKLLLSDRMLFGCSMNKFRKQLNKMSPEIRKKYHAAMTALNEDMVEKGGRDVQQMGMSIKAAADELGMKMSDAQYEHKLSRADMAGVRQKALERDVSFEAANAMFATPFGNGKLVDGALSKHITEGTVQSLIRFQNEIIDKVRLEDRTGRSPAELMYNLNREFEKFKADKSDEAWTRRENWLRDKLGIEKPEMFDTVRKYFRERYDHERSALFDREAIEMAVKENQFQVERTAAREKLFSGVRMAIEHRMARIAEKIAAHEGMENKTRKNQKTEQRFRKRLKELTEMHDIAKRDVKKLVLLGKSHILDKTNANQAMFRDLENGWGTDGGREYKKLAREVLINSALFNKNTRRRLAKIFHGEEKAMDMLEGVVQADVSFRKRRGMMGQLMKALENKNKKSEAVQELFNDNPPFKRAEVIRATKRNMRSLLDYAVKSRNVRGQIGGGLLRPIGDVVTTMLTTNPGKEASQRLRLMTQRVENFAQGPMGLLDRVRDKVRMLSDADFSYVDDLRRRPTDEIKAAENKKLRQIALDMRLVRDQIIRSQFSAGLITRSEMHKAITSGTHSHFYLDGQFRGDLSSYTQRDRMTLFPDTADIPQHGRLNIQKKFNTPRVTWFDRAKGEWKIKDFKPKPGEKLSGTIARAEKYRDRIRKKYPGMAKNDIEMVGPLTEEAIGFKGLIDKNLDFQIDAMRDMIHDLAKTHLMNEIGMMQGLVRTALPADARKRSAWVKVGGREGDLSPAQRRQERMKWGSLSGKYIHVSFFDQISAYDDATSVIRGVADSFRDTIKEAESRSGGRTIGGNISRLIQTLDEAAGKVAKSPLSQTLMRRASRHIRRNLITMNPASYINNFMGAVTFSHMAGAKVMSPEFWKGSIDGDSWRNFNHLLDEVGTREFEQLGTLAGDEAYRRRGLSDDDMKAVQLFKFAVDRGLIERTDEGVFTGARRRTGKRIKFRDLISDIEATSKKRYNEGKRKIRDINTAIQKIDQVLAEGDLRDRDVAQFQERRAAFEAMKKDTRKRVNRIPIDFHTQATQALPDRILAAAKRGQTELGRFIRTDSESAVHRIVSGWYGNIDPKLKWQTLRYLVEDAGMTREGALQRVLDFHQNYGTISPFIRNLRKMPLAGSFIPSFPAEAARILKNGFQDNIGRTLSPLMATAMWNQTALAANGQTVSDLANLHGDNDDPFGLARALVSQILIPDGDGGYYTADTMKYSPFAPFMRAEGLSKPFVEQVQKAGPLGAAVTPVLNFMSNFVVNTPTSQLIQKRLVGVDTFTGRVTTQDGVESALAGLAKDVAGLMVPKAISRPLEQANRVQQTPMSVITKRNVSAVDGALNTLGLNIKSLSKEQNIANMALRFMYKKEREAFIRNSISMGDGTRHEIYELGTMQVNTKEWADKLEGIVDDLVKQKPDELRIGSETIKLKKFDDATRDKIRDRVIAKASNNVYNVVEEMSPRRRLHFLRAVKQTWTRDEPVYEHAVRTFTNEDYLKRLSDEGDIAAVFTEAIEMSESTTDQAFRTDMRQIATAVAWRARQLHSNNSDRNEKLARALVRASKGDYKKRLMTLYSHYSRLLDRPSE